MKKIIFLFLLIMSLTGCKNEQILTCTKNNKINNISSKSSYKIFSKGDNVTKLTTVYEYKDISNNEKENKIIDGKVGNMLDDVVNDVTDGILSLAGIKTRHNNKFGTYVNTDGFKTKIDIDNETDYKITYIYDFDKLSDTDITNFGLNRSFDNLKKMYQNNNFICK